MATYGPRSTTELALPAGWDATELAKFPLADGTTYADVAADMQAAVNALNAEINSDPLWASLVSYTDQPELEYRVGSSNGFEEHTEFGRPDPKRGDTIGHMLPLRKYDRFLAWTADFLEEARMPQIEADIADAIKDARDLYRVRVLTRLLQRGDDSGANKGLGTGGYSPGFATTAASTNVDFVPPAWGGNTFSNTHEHYVAIAGGAFTAAVFQDARAELREHGHEPTYRFLIGLSDMDTVVGLTGFVPAPSLGITYGNGVSLAPLETSAIAAGVYPLGMIHDFAVFCVAGIPQYYGIGYRSYGLNSARNPLRIRVKKGQTAFGVELLTDPNGGKPIIPLQNVMLRTAFGVGVGDRTNGTPRYVNNNVWADGTPT